MCQHSLIVKNPALLPSLDVEGNALGYNYIPYYSKYSLVVPCGYCLQCQELKLKEWKLRLRYEMDRCNKNGGYVFKDELTYSDDKVSRIGEFMVFNKVHLQLFFKRLRKYIATFCKLRDIAPIKIKYFVSCEYGSHFTHRPHYHILVFVYDSQFSYLRLHHAIAHSWSYGFTNYNKGRNRKPDWTPKNKVVQSFAGVEYVTKYLFKDKSFFHGLLFQESDIVRKYLLANLGISVDSLRDKLLTDDTMFFNVVKLLRKSPFKDSIPFRMQSQGIGLSLLEHISFDDAVAGVFNDTLTSKLQYIPTYYKRKLLYDYNKLTRCFVKSEKYIAWIWNNERKTNLDFFEKFSYLPETLKFTFNSFDLDGKQLYKAYRLYTLLNDFSLPDEIPTNFGYPFEMDNLYNYITYLFETRDLFYSSVLRCSFNINDEFTDVNKTDFFDSNAYIRSHLCKISDCKDPLSLAFQSFDLWNRQYKDELGAKICQQINDRYISQKYKYDADLLVDTAAMLPMSLPF